MSINSKYGSYGAAWPAPDSANTGARSRPWRPHSVFGCQEVAIAGRQAASEHADPLDLSDADDRFWKSVAGTRRIELRDRVVAGAAFADKPPEEDRTLHDTGRAGPDRQGMSVVLVAVNEALATAFENRPGDVVRAVKPALIAPGDEPGSGGPFTLRTDRALSRKESGRRQHPRRADGASSGQDRNTGSLTGARCRRESGTVQAGRNVAGHRATQPSPGKDRRWMA